MPTTQLLDTVWLFVCFDLPTKTDLQRKRTQRFRKTLLHNGFVMIQYSIYARHCYNHAHANVFERRVSRYIPTQGHVFILRIRDSQFGNMRHFWGGHEKENYAKKQEKQLLIF